MCIKTLYYITFLRKSRWTGTKFQSFTLWGESIEKGDLKLIGERAAVRWREVPRNKLRVDESGDWYISTVFRIKSFGYMPFTLRLGSLSRIIRGNCLILRKFLVDLPSWSLTFDQWNRECVTYRIRIIYYLKKYNRS